MTAQTTALPLSSIPAASPSTRKGRQIALGAAAIGFAVVFNIPFSVLGATFDYPQVLRRPPGEVLDLFAAAGPGLVLTWYAFMLCALALIPLSGALAITRQRLAARPGLALTAAAAGALAGLAQAIGLQRWVFTVPGLARLHADPATSPDARLAAERTFDMLGQFAGVGIGEHIGQLLTALFIACLARLQWSERQRVTASLGALAAAIIALGTGEGLAIAMGQSGETFALATILGFAGLTLWLIASGVALIRGRAA